MENDDMEQMQERLRKEWISKMRAESGRKGGSAKVPKGFATDRKLASEAGKKGGSRGKKT